MPPLVDVFFFLMIRRPPRSTLFSLHDALPISQRVGGIPDALPRNRDPRTTSTRSEEHTSELQSQSNLVCRLLLEKKKDITAPAQSRQHRRADARARSSARRVSSAGGAL